LELIGHGVVEGKSDEDIITESLSRIKEAYEQNQEEYNQIFGDDWNDFGDFEGNF
jgi:hypothetical protein